MSSLLEALRDGACDKDEKARLWTQLTLACLTKSVVLIHLGSLVTLVIRTQLSMIAGQTFLLHNSAGNHSRSANKKIPESVQQTFLTRVGQTVLLQSILPSVTSSVQAKLFHLGLSQEAKTVFRISTPSL